MNDEQHIDPTASEDVETIKKQSEEYLAGWKRAQADYANLKKESEREKQEFAKYANERLLESLLPAIDQYETALSFTPDLVGLPEDEQKKFKNWIIGLHAVRALWESAFQAIGLEKVEGTGMFDPNLHEAVSEEAGDGEAGRIVRTVQDGWKLNGKLIRPAKVVITKES
ncbi:MAG: nucleotide exchange factor GrpE [Patescibacteria group bacterium]|jgi:molecular chaperone GrpE